MKKSPYRSPLKRCSKKLCTNVPNHKGHLVGGFCTFLLLIFFISAVTKTSHAFSPFYFIAYAACTLAGSLFPDIDIKSKGQRLFSLLMLPIISAATLYQQWLLLCLLSSSILVPLIAYHRGLTHYIWFVIAIPLLVPVSVTYLAPEYTAFAYGCYFFFVAGALSHLILDFGPRNLWRRGLSGWPRRRKKKW